MTEKRKEKSVIERAEDAFKRLGGLLSQVKSQLEEVERERDVAVANLNAAPIAISPESTPITSERLELLGLAYLEKFLAWHCNIGRLSLFIHDDGRWSAHYQGTFGGRVSSYRQLQSMEEVEQLVRLLGCNLRASAEKGGA